MQREGRAACAPCSPQLPPHPAARPGHHGESLGTGPLRGSAGAGAVRCGGMGAAEFSADGGRGGGGGLAAVGRGRGQEGCGEGCS